MTEAEMKAQIEAAQDMLESMEQQRNAHANNCVQLAAQAKALQRTLAELDKRIAQLEVQVKELTPPEDVVPKPNGHVADPEPAHAA